MVVADTTFFIDLMRELHRDTVGPATQKLRELQDQRERLVTTTVSIGELYHGAYKSEDQKEITKVDRLASRIPLLEFDAEAADHFGRVAADLQVRGEEIGVPDTQIAGLAIANDESLLTKNVKHFGRVSGLNVVSY